MKDLLLDVYTHDLTLVNYDLAIVDGIDHVRQHLKIRLLFMFGEWFLDSTQGIRYYDLIAVKNPDMALVDSIIKATILETPEVTGLTEYSSEYDPRARRFSVTFTAKTSSGNITLTIGAP
jgi:hypothetical protein